MFEFDKIACTLFDGVRVNPKMKPSHIAQSKDSFQDEASTLIERNSRKVYISKKES